MYYFLFLNCFIKLLDNLGHLYKYKILQCLNILSQLLSLGKKSSVSIFIEARLTFLRLLHYKNRFFTGKLVQLV